MNVFKEEQRFIQTWLIVLLAVSIIVPMAIIINTYLEDNSTMTTNEFVFTIAGILLSVSFIFFFKLTTRIDEKGIHYQFFPFHFSMRKITWSEIEKAHVRTYDPISEYGGWGLKGGAFWNKSKGTAINVSGDVGIQLELKNGKKLLIGTQKENQVNLVLKKYQNKIIA
ncbi:MULTISPECIES: hypothetical protein [Tenacibaculum]|uniref:hypothetical protein n=1 Tax=Tenacibaculum TaxID=104267 RepID=UPI001F0A6ABB|nr:MULTISPECIES: hypothetical protein [Tenacibaculum]MCH3883069.1 hypothetical protein [Tenacibaculum aquimarinum]MDO6600564.1 hypothetical protein [Tenacibaculum sp. 1_MG-2023]